MQMTDRREAAPGVPIEQGIGIPANRVPHQRAKWERAKLRFDLLQVGDSFQIGPEHYPPSTPLLVVQNWISGAACIYRKSQPPGSWAFTTRQNPATGTVRVWRIEPHQARGRGRD